MYATKRKLKRPNFVDGAILKDRPFQALALNSSSGRQSGLTDLANALCHLAALGFPVRLENWENPEPPAEEYRMRVPVAGANFRSPEPPARQHRHLPPPANSGRRPPLSENPPGSLTAVSAAPVLSRHTPPAGKENMAKNNNGNTDPISDALRSVQEGLKAIQTIQLQTARAHEKFLETQSEATRVLLELVKNTNRLAGLPSGALEARRFPISSTAVEAAPSVTSQPAAATAQPPPVPTVDSISADASAAPPPAVIAAAPPTTPSPALRPELATVLLTVVSELTGYPVEW